ncbi:MAG: glycine--tRNA ligase subunit beta, partial [Myxococcales bacterium]|nr:glycine--tRNA ligase subunit beta [Myxococcales bacterium]
PDASAYVARLGDAKVLVDPAARRARMIEALEAEAKRIGGKVVPDEFLVDECMALVELPHAIAGAFNPEFLNLPESVVIAVMRNHQRYFAVRNAAGALMPAYLNVVNTANAPQVIAQGNDRVLRARLKDAQFFVGEDRKVRLEDRVPNLDRVVYQAKLGTVGARVRRLAALVQALGAGEEAKLAAEAATLAKADLVSYIVGEFPELQGEMGRFYALEQGVAPRVADAIRDHYLPKGAGDAVPTDAVGALVAVADRADALVGCFGIGLVPTGSADPFALRRAAIGLARIALEGPLDVDVKQTFGAAYDQFDGVALRPKDDVLAQLDEFVRARLRAFYGEAFPGDLVEACLGAWDGASLRDLDARIRAVAKFREMPAYASLSVAFKRAFNIAKDAPVGEADPKLFADDAEKMLGERFAGVRSVIETAVAAGDYESALVAVANELREPIDKFFETVFVMVDDEKVRENRLRLLGTIARTLTSIARFDQLSA